MYGILSDKLHQAPRSVTNALHIHLKGDRTGAVATLLGTEGMKRIGLRREELSVKNSDTRGSVKDSDTVDV